MPVILEVPRIMIDMNRNKADQALSHTVLSGAAAGSGYGKKHRQNITTVAARAGERSAGVVGNHCSRLIGG